MFVCCTLWFVCCLRGMLWTVAVSEDKAVTLVSAVGTNIFTFHAVAICAFRFPRRQSWRSSTKSDTHTAAPHCCECSFSFTNALVFVNNVTFPTNFSFPTTLFDTLLTLPPLTTFLQTVWWRLPGLLPHGRGARAVDGGAAAEGHQRRQRRLHHDRHHRVRLCVMSHMCVYLEAKLTHVSLRF